MTPGLRLFHGHGAGGAQLDYSVSALGTEIEPFNVSIVVFVPPGTICFWTAVFPSIPIINSAFSFEGTYRDTLKGTFTTPDHAEGILGSAASVYGVGLVWIRQPWSASRGAETGEVFVFKEGIVGAVDELKLLPERVELEQNYPNPFNPATTVSFSIPSASRVSLEVFNTLGVKVATLVDEEREAGKYSVRWDAGGVSSGVYFYRLHAGKFMQVRKALVLK